ncbi:MAG: hypothetical protein Pars2KO_05550 [Parasphingorhabdus sp.]
MKEKIEKFIQKYGLTYRSIFIALVVLPPAALFIIWKKPKMNIVLRLVLSLIALGPVFLLIGGMDYVYNNWPW